MICHPFTAIVVATLGLSACAGPSASSTQSVQVSQSAALASDPVETVFGDATVKCRFKSQKGNNNEQAFARLCGVHPKQ